MSANILVVEYEPRYVEHVRTALADAGFRLEIAGNLDDAVNRCATFEPTITIITSVLPNLKIEDAITQLRARAGLRQTPFLILMSGYTGDDPAGDAERYGAQDILPRPFGADALRETVEKLVLNAPSPAATQAIPQEMLEALRRSAGLDGEGGSVTSDDLFGDILSDVEGGEEAPVSKPVDEPFEHETPPRFSKAPSAPAKEKEKPAAPATASPEDKPLRTPTPVHPPKPKKTDGATKQSAVDDVLANILESSKAASAPKKRAPERDVDKLLEDTLAGLDIHPSPKAEKPAAPPAAKKVAAPPAQQPPPAELPPPPDPPPVEPVKPVREVVPPVAKKVGRPAEVAPPKPKRVAPEVTPPEEKKIAAESPPPQVKSFTPETEIPAPMGSQFGQYVIEDHIATGGMADVYKARMMGMEGFQKTVAIKRILSNLTDSEEFVRMFIDEAKLAAQLNHDNIIHIYDLGKVDRSHYIAMEFIEGRDLRTILRDSSEKKLNMPIELALYVTTLLASALDYAHKKQDFENRDLGLVHRDVSPQNVLISFDGNVKLCDFGIAKAASKASQTRAGALKGKLQYMSPEQAWGKDIDHRSDIFSLGLVLYEMLVCEKVFEGTSELSVLEQVRDPIISAPSMKNPEVDADIDRIVFLALNADREQRYQSAQDLQRDLERVLRSKGWSPDRETVARFLRLLAGEEEVESRPVPKPAAPLPPARAATAGPSDRISGAPPKEETPVPDFSPEEAADPDLERALTDSGETPAGVAAIDFDSTDPGHLSSGSGGSGPKRILWLVLAVVLIAALAVAGWWYMTGRKAAPPENVLLEPAAVAATETPTPVPTVGLMSEDEMLERARQVAAAEIDRQEEDLRQRLEAEFPTPTPIPPTPTPTETATPEPTPTSTPVPPTRTPMPPTMTPIRPTATPSVREGDIVAAGPGVSPPVIVQREAPEYPAVASRMKVGGVVEAKALVGIDGAVEEVRIISVSRKGVGFEDATETAIMKWRYKPATKNGVKVRVWVAIRVPFQGTR